MRIQDRKHAIAWLNLYNQKKLNYLLDDLAKTEQGCLILETINVALLPKAEVIPYQLTLINEQKENMLTFLEDELLDSNYEIIPATNKLANLMDTI